VTAGLLVASSGVAAAVTGNPIGPLQHVVDSLVHHGNGATVDSDGTLTGPTLPTTAATAADLNVLLVGVARAIATGQCDVAATKLADAQAALTALPATSTADPSGETAARAAFQGRIDALTQRLASAHTCSPTSGANSHGRGQSGTHATGNGAGDANGHHGGGNAQPNGTGKSSTGTSSPRSKPTSKPTSDPTSEPTSEPTSAPSPQSTVDNAPHATGGGSAHAPS
jgi:hypothetical protein